MLELAAFAVAAAESVLRPRARDAAQSEAMKQQQSAIIAAGQDSLRRALIIGNRFYGQTSAGITLEGARAAKPATCCGCGAPRSGHRCEYCRREG